MIGFYQEILKAYGNDKVKEQIEQLTEVPDPIEFLHLFCIAGRLREWIFGKVVFRNIRQTISVSSAKRHIASDSCNFRVMT